MTWTIQATELGNLMACSRENGVLKTVHLVRDLKQLPQGILAEAELLDDPLDSSTTGGLLDNPATDDLLDKTTPIESLDNSIHGEVLDKSTPLGLLDSPASGDLLDKPTTDGALPKCHNINGWTVRQDGKGYWKGYRRSNGRLMSIHIGKDLSVAQTKIIAVSMRDLKSRYRPQHDHHHEPLRCPQFQ